MNIPTRVRLTDMQLLNGKLETITAMQLRAAPGDILDSVMAGKVFVVTKHNKPVAVISRIPGAQLSIKFNAKGERSYTLES